MVTANLINVLILPDPIDTPWINTTIYGVPGTPIHRNRPTILASESAKAFADAMNNMNLSFSYDFAIAFTKY